jgi:hypothetical protein
MIIYSSIFKYDLINFILVILDVTEKEDLIKKDKKTKTKTKTKNKGGIKIL